MFDKSIVSENFINHYNDTSSFKEEYSKSKPFPNIVFNNFFNQDFLEQVLMEFPNLALIKSSENYNNKSEVKFANNEYNKFPESIKKLINFMNSENFINFLQDITSIEEKLVPDYELNGGGLHEIKNGGYLKIHTDFNKHPNSGLDRRVNILIYLNKNWRDDYGGDLQLWDKNMKKCEKKIFPNFNTMVIFTTNDFSNHGHPDPINCPEEISRKSIALYYFSDGRPNADIDLKNIKNKTYFKNRDGYKDVDNSNLENFKNFLRKFDFYKKIKELEKKYIRKKR